MLHVACFMRRGHVEIHKQLSWQHHHLLSFRRILQSGLPPFLLSAITYARSHTLTPARLRAHTLTQAYKHQIGYETHACPALGRAPHAHQEVAAFLAVYHVATSCPRPQDVATAPCRSEALRCIRSRPCSACAAAAVALLMADGGLPMRRALAKVVKARPATDLRQGSQVGGELDRAVRHDGHPSLASIMPCLAGSMP